jgi:hypothetical protein
MFTRSASATTSGLARRWDASPARVRHGFHKRRFHLIQIERVGVTQLRLEPALFVELQLNTRWCSRWNNTRPMPAFHSGLRRPAKSTSRNCDVIRGANFVRLIHD